MNEELQSAIRTEVDAYIGEKDAGESFSLEDAKTVLAAAAVLVVVAYGIRTAWNKAVNRKARKLKKEEK